ncbi:hypothetical protein [Variovorax sp. PAMC 28711]|uniref:hypothetical protein n=1 Tax=Variovorax sp. PAMC 28711 TaxID=1795631 RepID=UPI0012E74C94|nr:hypothetical protein [Variovorax sp. PAMC 28711]
MNTGELDRMVARVDQFFNRGISLKHAIAVADALVIRDRGSDDRRLCLECSNIRGTIDRSRCTVWLQADISRQEMGELVSMPQRCPAFSDTGSVR